MHHRHSDTWSTSSELAEEDYEQYSTSDVDTTTTYEYDSQPTSPMPSTIGTIEDEEDEKDEEDPEAIDLTTDLTYHVLLTGQSAQNARRNLHNAMNGLQMAPAEIPTVEDNTNAVPEVVNPGVQIPMPLELASSPAFSEEIFGALEDGAMFSVDVPTDGAIVSPVSSLARGGHGQRHQSLNETDSPEYPKSILKSHSLGNPTVEVRKLQAQEASSSTKESVDPKGKKSSDLANNEVKVDYKQWIDRKPPGPGYF